MSGYDWLEITAPNDYKRLAERLDSEFGPKEIGAKLQCRITGEVAAILIEHGYIDKDYRSTFYNFYAKMGRSYRDDCVRLHFFDDCVKFDEVRTDITCPDDRLEDHYFGYIVLRPMIFSTLGRSLLSPRIWVGAHGRVIQACHRVHLLGHTLSVWGFPSMAQHADIAVCAHVSCWAILRHYSESKRFPRHREFLIHDMTTLATPFDPGGLTPSLGLEDLEAERIFQAAGCFPVRVDKRCGDDPQFYTQLLAYLESGFPLYVGTPGHAFVAAGYAWHSPAVKSQSACSHVWSQVESILTVDDNLLPYNFVASEPDSSTDTVEDFEAFIVPLPDKIYYSAGAMESLSVGLPSVLKHILELPDDKLLRRYFITTISELRGYARGRQSEMGDVLVDLFMRLSTAQFVWIVEYASDRQWAQGHIAARAIVDATASPKDKSPLWLAHDGKLAIVFDRTFARADGTKLVKLDRPLPTPLGRMELDL